MRVDKTISKIVDIVLVILFMAIFIMVFYQVVLRYVFSTAIFGTAEVFTMLFAYASALGSAAMIRSRQHIKISVFIDRLPEKWRKAVLVFDYFLIAVFSFFIVYQSIPWLKSIRFFRSQVTGISRTVESIMIPVGFSLIIFYCIVNVLSLYLSPSETALEFASGETEVTMALEDAMKTESNLSKKKDQEDSNT